MNGRGSMGKPWMFNEINKQMFLSEKEKLDIIYKHIDKVMEHSNNDTKALLPLRAHFAFYTKGYEGSAKARQIIFQSTESNEIKQTFQKLLL
jgi:tRNA-dihydrouridine synthase